MSMKKNVLSVVCSLSLISSYLLSTQLLAVEAQGQNRDLELGQRPPQRIESTKDQHGGERQVRISKNYKRLCLIGIGALVLTAAGTGQYFGLNSSDRSSEANNGDTRSDLFPADIADFPVFPSSPELDFEPTDYDEDLAPVSGPAPAPASAPLSDARPVWELDEYKYEALPQGASEDIFADDSMLGRWSWSALSPLANEYTASKKCRDSNANQVVLKKITVEMFSDHMELIPGLGRNRVILNPSKGDSRIWEGVAETFTVNNINGAAAASVEIKSTYQVRLYPFERKTSSFRVRMKANALAITF